MGNIVQFKGRSIKSKKLNQTSNHTSQGSAGEFMEMVDVDTMNLSTATGKTTEEAIQIASDFYRRYPMLMEYVRSAEYMTRNK